MKKLLLLNVIFITACGSASNSSTDFKNHDRARHLDQQFDCPKFISRMGIIVKGVSTLRDVNGACSNINNLESYVVSFEQDYTPVVFTCGNTGNKEASDLIQDWNKTIEVEKIDNGCED